MTQPGCSRSLTLAACFGGIAVASKTWTRWLAASTTQTSFSSGVRPMPWLGQPCRLTVPFLNAGTSTRCSFLPGLQVADLEAEQLVDVHEAQRLRAVDGERPDRRRERPDLVDDLVRLRVRDEQQRRLQPGQVHPRAVEAARPCCAPRSWSRSSAITLPGRGVDDVPDVLLERRHVERLAVGRDRHAVAALRQFLAPRRVFSVTRSTQ